MADFEFQAIASPTAITSTRALLSLRNEVRRNLLTDSDFYTDADINNAINRAYRRITEHTKAYRTKTTTVTVSGTYQYDKPANCIEIKTVMFNNTKLNKVDLNTIQSSYAYGSGPTAQIGNPYVWADYNYEQIWIYPTPNSALNLDIIASAYPADLYADADVSIYPMAGDAFLIYDATRDLLRRDNELGKSNDYRRDALAALDEVKRLVKVNPEMGYVDTPLETPFWNGGGIW